MFFHTFGASHFLRSPSLDFALWASLWLFKFFPDKFVAAWPRESDQREGAVGDAAKLDNLRDYSDQLVDAAQKLSKGAVNYQQQLQLFIDAAKEGADGMDKVKDKLKEVAEDLATQRSLLVFGQTP